MASVLAAEAVTTVAPVKAPPNSTVPLVAVKPLFAAVSTATAGVDATPLTVETRLPLVAVSVLVFTIGAPVLVTPFTVTVDVFTVEAFDTTVAGSTGMAWVLKTPVASATTIWSVDEVLTCKLSKRTGFTPDTGVTCSVFVGVVLPIPTFTALVPVPPKTRLLLAATLALEPIAVALAKAPVVTSALVPRKVLLLPVVLVSPAFIPIAAL